MKAVYLLLDWHTYRAKDVISLTNVSVNINRSLRTDIIYMGPFPSSGQRHASKDSRQDYMKYLHHLSPPEDCNRDTHCHKDLAAQH